MVSPETLKKAKYSALMLAGATIDLGNDKEEASRIENLLPSFPIHAISARDPAALAFIRLKNSGNFHPSSRANIRKKISTTTQSAFFNNAWMHSVCLTSSVQGR